MKKLNFCDNWTCRSGEKDAHAVIIPHDAMQEEGRAPDGAAIRHGAYFKGGVYTYEKTFFAPAEWESKAIFVEFEGVYPSAQVLLNGKKIGVCAYGYRGFRLKLDDLHYGAENVLTVLADNSNLPNSRWYTGSGIYRPVWLWVGEDNYIEPDGIRVTTLSIEPAVIRVETKHTGNCANIEILWDGTIVASGSGNCTEFSIPDAKLWSDETPNLYTCRVTLDSGDSQKVQFGIRKVEWNNQGLWINGKQTLLRGGCIHHDNGILGARSFDESEWRRIKILKDAGFNAIRSSHNPACRAMLEACDYYGLYVMDEGWDMWYTTKTKYDYSHSFRDNYRTDLEAMVSKDYNHPCVIMYSIGNELSEPSREEGVALTKEMVDLLHRLDSSRAVTAGANLMILLLNSMGIDLFNGGEEKPREEIDSTKFNEMAAQGAAKMEQAAASEGADKAASPFLDLLDIAGYNYATSRYPLDGALHPDRVIVGSETYPQDLPRNWAMVEKYPYLIGDFMWTAWDYLGEVGLGSWSYEPDAHSFNKDYPWLLAESGIYDILGHEAGSAGMASVVWRTGKDPYIGVVPVNHPGEEVAKSTWRGSNALPYWSYSGCDGNEAEVEVYTRGHHVELFLNGEKIGVEEPAECKVVFRLSYQPGELKAVSYDAEGHVLGEDVLRSADCNTKISVCPEKPIKDGVVRYVNIYLTGKNGEVECNRDVALTVTVEGGQLLAFGSANPKTAESFLAGTYRTWYGKSQAVILPTQKTVTITVFGEGLETAHHTFSLLHNCGNVIK